MSGMKMLIFIVFTMLLRSHYASITIPLRLYTNITTLILRPHDNHDLSTFIVFSLQPYHDLSDLTTFLLRLQHALTTTIPCSYCDLPRNNVNIVFHINTVSFLLFLIDTQSFSETTQSCYQNLRKSKGSGRGRRRDMKETNHDPELRQMSDQPIQPE